MNNRMYKYYNNVGGWDAEGSFLKNNVTRSGLPELLPRENGPGRSQGAQNEIDVSRI
jgi:hypothetical protein